MNPAIRDTVYNIFFYGHRKKKKTKIFTSNFEKPRALSLFFWNRYIIYSLFLFFTQLVSRTVRYIFSSICTSKDRK